MAEINPSTVAGSASQVAKYDGTANMRANPQTFRGTNQGGNPAVRATGTPSGAGYGSNLAQADGTANLRADGKTMQAAMPTTPSGKAMS